MKFRNEKIELGTRFYTFISEHEYRIVTFVKDNTIKRELLKLNITGVKSIQKTSFTLKHYLK